MARRRRLKFIRRTALALAACAVVLPATAQARVLNGATLGASDASAKTYAPAYGFGYGESAAARFGVAPHGPLVLHRSRLVLQSDGTLVAKTPVSQSPSGPRLRVVDTSQPVASPESGFGWADAGIGAGVALAAGALLTLIAVMAIRGRSQRGGLAGA
jgi:hypothetical protein